MYDLMIIGAGPAGLSAGIYAGRFGLDTLILERMQVGGQIILSPTIENFPGFPGGISTPELIDKFKKQIQDLKLKIEIQAVKKISLESKGKISPYRIKTEDKTYVAKTIIIATGAIPQRLKVEGEEKFIGKGVSYCGTCDGPLFKNKDIAVIGGGDRAIAEAIFLSSYARKVLLIHRRGKLRASGILEEKAKKNPKINFILENVVEEICGENKVEKVLIKNVKTNSQSELSCAGIFIFVGITPQTTFLKNLLETDEKGFIITDESMQTSCKGIFAAGDCRKKSLYQVVTACAEGAVAADSVHKYLSEATTPHPEKLS